jgi:hypothetical protein
VAPLCRLLERILRTCQQEGIRYPPILLRRKKEMQRGVWEPARVPSASRKPLGQDFAVSGAAQERPR